MRDPYEVLGVLKTASDSDIKKAYRGLASKYHPDRVAHLGPELEALTAEKFKEISAAYQHLTGK